MHHERGLGSRGALGSQTKPTPAWVARAHGVLYVGVIPNTRRPSATVRNRRVRRNPKPGYKL